MKCSKSKILMHYVFAIMFMMLCGTVAAEGVRLTVVPTYVKLLNMTPYHIHHD